MCCQPGLNNLKDTQHIFAGHCCIFARRVMMYGIEVEKSVEHSKVTTNVSNDHIYIYMYIRMCACICHYCTALFQLEHSIPKCIRTYWDDHVMS